MKLCSIWSKSSENHSLETGWKKELNALKNIEKIFFSFVEKYIFLISKPVSEFFFV